MFGSFYYVYLRFINPIELEIDFLTVGMFVTLGVVTVVMSFLIKYDFLKGYSSS
jgi:hypothetical protein